jgi:hypothetical protein
MAGVRLLLHRLHGAVVHGMSNHRPNRERPETKGVTPQAYAGNPEHPFGETAVIGRRATEVENFAGK